MATPKAQTLQQRFGFHDKDLMTPKHDEIMIWLDEHITEILSSFPKIHKRFGRPDSAITVIEKRWEFPIHQFHDRMNGETTQGICIGFIDFVVFYTYTVDGGYGRYQMNFEVKTAIPSLGELFRQINMYRSYENNPFCVVCPDDRFAQQIQKQGIGFLKYEQNKFDKKEA